MEPIDTNPMRIGELATRTGVSRRLLRYYEERGLLSPARSASDQRLYDPESVGRVAQIRELLGAGLSTERIFDLLPCLASPPNERTTHLLDGLRAERRRIEDSIRSLQSVGDALDEVIERVVEADSSTTPGADGG